MWYRLLTAVVALALAAGACRAAAPPDMTDPTPGPAAPSPTGDAQPTEPSADCSASGLSVDDVPDLPEAVARTRRAIAEAAAECDYDALARLAADDGFTHSFGAGGDPAESWRREEAGDGEPLRFLVELLDRPHSTVEAADGPTQYVWPSAFAYQSWDAVPDGEREALRPLYDDQDFASFENFGGYIGYRVGIEDDGSWRFFVAGD